MGAYFTVRGNGCQEFAARAGRSRGPLPAAPRCRWTLDNGVIFGYFRHPSKCSAPIAQLVERLTLNQRVRGSNPCGRTNIYTSALPRHSEHRPVVLYLCRAVPNPSPMRSPTSGDTGSSRARAEPALSRSFPEVTAAGRSLQQRTDNGDCPQNGLAGEFTFRIDTLLTLMEKSLKTVVEKRPKCRKLTFCIPLN